VTVFLLIRHAEHTHGGDAIVGRSAEAPLSTRGRAQAIDLADRLSDLCIAAVYASPLERTMETARPLADRLRLTVEPCVDLLEIDYGDWSGATLGALGGDERWTHWNSFRSGQRVPRGESMIEAEARIVGWMISEHAERSDQTVAVVSHGDLVKAALAHFLGTPLDLFQRIEVGHCSVSVVVVEDGGPTVRCVNHCGPIRDLLEA
jgi:broad specificity phosphatase PhoE